MGLALLCVVWGLPSPWPPAEDLDRFPCEAVAKEYVKLGEHHIKWLEMQRPWQAHRQAEWDAWIWEAKMLNAQWDALLRVHLGGKTYTREHLESLRWSIGWTNYAAGRMPSPVPLERFERR